MASDRAPWHPDPQWADPLIGLLGTISLLAGGLALGAQRRGPATPNPVKTALLSLPPASQVLWGLATMLLLAAGFAVLAYLLATRHEPRPQAPRWSMSGRAAALVFLGWFCAYLLVNATTLLLIRNHPGARLVALPLSYALHAAIGIRLLLKAEGLDLRGLRDRLAPGATLSQLLWAPAFLALGFLLALAASLALAPLLRHAPDSQAQLVELLRSAHGAGWTLLMLVTVSGLAPCFEETLVRGFLLAWMAPRWGWGRALAASSLLFGLIHLQLSSLPGLSALGVALGLALWRTGSLRTSIAVHALWNGSVFLLVRLVA